MAASKQKKRASKPESESEGEEYVVEAIRSHKRTDKGLLKYRVKWLGYNKASDDTWEPEANLSNCALAIKKYWKTKAPEEQLERYKFGSKEYKKLKAEIDEALGEDELQSEPEQDDKVEKSAKKDKKAKSRNPKHTPPDDTSSPVNGASPDETSSAAQNPSPVKNSAPVKSSSRAKKRKASPISPDESETNDYAKSNKKQKRHTSAATEAEPEGDNVHDKTVVGAPVVFEADQTNDAEEENAESEQADEGYDPSGRYLVEWQTVTTNSEPNSWEDLVEKIGTVEEWLDNPDDKHKMLCEWKQQTKDDLKRSSWVASKLTRRTCPQKMIDFYEFNLKFKRDPEVEEPQNEQLQTPGEESQQH
ncbi:chromo domain-containing protein [Sporobolomyces koalae]|uniref:chromo domain-containing protein n=1 Tax=Sporobolomyces koalae TaxID=500713 RepID=UPI00316DFB76